MYHKQQQNQVPKQKNLKDLNEIKQLKTNSELKVINLVINQCQYYSNNYYESEVTIAVRLGRSVRTVCRAITRAKELGLIRIKRRINNSNIYSLNPELRNPSILEELASVLPALRGVLCLSILIPMAAICKPATRRCLPENGVQYNIKEDLNKTKRNVSNTLTTKKEDISYDRSFKNRKYRKEQELKVDMHNQMLAQNHHKSYNYTYKAEIQTQGNSVAMYRLRDKLIDTVYDVGVRSGHIDVESIKNRTHATVYENNATVFEFKEFITERLPRLKESIAQLDLTPAKKEEIINRQLQVYRDRLHFKDCLQLRAEGFPI